MRQFKPHELVKVIADLQSRIAVLEAASNKPVTATVESSPAAPVVVTPSEPSPVKKKKKTLPKKV